MASNDPKWYRQVKKNPALFKAVEQNHPGGDALVDWEQTAKQGRPVYKKMSGLDKHVQGIGRDEIGAIVGAATLGAGGAMLGGLGAAGGAGATGGSTAGAGGVLGGLAKVGGFLWDNKDLILGGLSAINAARDSSKANEMQKAMLARAEAKDAELAPLRALAMQRAQAPMPTAPDLAPLFKRNNPNPFAG